MQTKYSHLTDTELLRLRHNPVDKALVEELFSRLEDKIAETPASQPVKIKYMGEVS